MSSIYVLMYSFIDKKYCLATYKNFHKQSLEILFIWLFVQLEQHNLKKRVGSYFLRTKLTFNLNLYINDGDGVTQ